MITLASTPRAPSPVPAQRRSEQRPARATYWTPTLRRTVAFVAVALTLSTGRAAGAQPEVELACGSGADFLEQLHREYDLAPESIPLNSVRIKKRPQGDYALLVQGPHGSRKVTHKNCSTLRQTALVMAATSGVASASDAAVGRANPAAPVAEPNADPSSTHAGEADATRPAARKLATRTFGFGIAAGAELGLAPAPAAVFEAHGAARWQRFGARIVGRYYLGQSAQHLTPEGYGLRWNAWGARFSGFFQPVNWMRAEVGLGVTHLHARGLHVRTQSSDQIWLLSPELELAWMPLRWANWALELAVRGRVGLRQPRFALEPNHTVIHQVPRWGAAGLFRVSWEN